MSNESTGDDKWLDVISGKSNSLSDSRLSEQTLSLRRALKANLALLNAKTPPADENLFNEIHARLHREGAFNSNKGKFLAPTIDKKQDWLGQSIQWVSGTLGIDLERMQGARVWGPVVVLAAVAMLIYSFTTAPKPDNMELLRGSGIETVLIVSDPESRLLELLAGIKSSGEEASVKRDAKGQIFIAVKATQPVLDYLSTQRIDPQVKDGYVLLHLSKAKAGPQN